uniref:Facilitated trehalose transporter Tret1 n=1 Tax=Culicoides sonorensis TaxID=179676 RepID=A0A336LI37_CULSO
MSEAPGVTNPMLYDPIPEGSQQTTKLMQFVAASGVCFAAISAGTALAWTAPVLPQLGENSTTLPVLKSQEPWIGSFLAIGAFFGALPCGILAEKIGRKFTTMSLALPFLISWGLIIFASNAGMLMAGRFFAGLATGASCVVAPMFVSEIAETSIRGTLGAFFQLFLTIGILFIYVVGAITNWITLSVLCAIFPILLAVAMIFIPESPTYLVKNSRRIDAGLSLKWFWGQNCDTQVALQAIQNDIDAVSADAKLKDLFVVPSNRSALIVSLSLMLFQQFSGINAVIFYTNSIFESAGSTLDPAICSIIVGIVQVLMTFVSAVLIDKAGRKILLLQSSIVMGTCLTTLGIYFHLKDGGSDVTSIGWLPLGAVVLFIISFSLGFGPIPWLIMGELFAPDVKGVASALAVMFNWTLVFVVTQTFGPLNDSIGGSFTFWLFALFMLICTFFVFIKVPETKGKTNAQIQAILSGKK